jgi:uncharacterized protein (TIGR02271 family)
MARERSTVVGVFRERPDAERAIEELQRMGFRDDQIGFVMHGAEGVQGTTATEVDSHAGEGALSGALAGAGLGGLIAAAAALLIPGFGPVIAGGILATVVGGAAVGAVAGGIVGALVGLGVPKEEAEYYEGEFKEGRILVTVKADGRYQEVRNLLRRHGAYDIEDRGAMRTGTATTASTAAPIRHEESERMELREEQLRARTRPVETGEVTVRKDVVTERQQIEVPVQREEVVIERHPVEGRPSEGGLRPGEEIRVPVHEERVTVEKQPVTYEEVDVGKRTVRETEHISGEVRREEARIEQEGDVPVHGTTGMRSWQELAPQYRQRWQSRYGSSGGRWEESEPYYRYGYEMAADPRYQGGEWGTVESDLRRDYGTWAQRSGYAHDDSAWERFKDRVREAWDEGRGGRRAA